MQIRIVLVSDDDTYSRTVLAEMSGLEHDLVIHECTWAEARGSQAAELFPPAEDHYPTIMMLDFAFVRRTFDRIAEQVRSLRQRMAIECLVVRPPSDEFLRDRLAQLGLWIYPRGAAPLIGLAVVQ